MVIQYFLHGFIISLIQLILLNVYITSRTAHYCLVGRRLESPGVGPILVILDPFDDTMGEMGAP